MTVGLAIIARNEEDSLPRLLESIDGCFDQVVLLDTGSKDKTKEVFIRWAEDQKAKWLEANDNTLLKNDKGNPVGFYKVRDMKWVDDFSVARNEAHALLDTDWEVWADCDDVIVGAQNIRSMVAEAPPELAGYICDYNYAQDPNTGQCLCTLKRERIVRRHNTKWEGAVHEAQPVNGPITMVPPETLVWVHQKGLEASESQYQTQRNLRILRKWLKAEPQNTRVLAYVGTELAARGKHKEAIGYYKRYLKLNPDWYEEQAQVCRKMAASLFALGRGKEARDIAFRAMVVSPTWPDSYTTMAEYHFHNGEFEKSMYWADRTLELGVPDTVLIVNPLDYIWLPLKFKCLCYIELRQFDNAIAIGKQALAVWGSEMGLQQAVGFAQAQAKREHTAETFVMCCQQLIAHDEQWKAKTLIEDCVPHFAYDHPAVVQIRSMLRERLMWLDGGYADHYETGGSKPEDFLPDDQIDAVGDAISRTGMLAYELEEQYESQKS